MRKHSRIYNSIMGFCFGITGVLYSIMFFVDRDKDDLILSFLGLILGLLFYDRSKK
jgi:glycopeptide antibiotics resistance protein